MGNCTTPDTAGGYLEDRVARLERRVDALEAQAPGATPAPVSQGELLRRRRRHLGHTQAQAASAIGVNQSTVSKWERGERIGWDHAGAVSAYLGVEPAAFLAHCN